MIRYKQEKQAGEGHVPSVAVKREPFHLDSHLNSANCSFTIKHSNGIMELNEFCGIPENYYERLKSWKLLKESLRYLSFSSILCPNKLLAIFHITGKKKIGMGKKLNMCFCVSVSINKNGGWWQDGSLPNK